MSIKASVGFTLLLFTAACAGRSVETRPIKPENGPKGTINATVSGPSMYRQLEANFRLDEPGYALVGHLGGDGMIRVIYPESPDNRSNRIAARTRIRTARFDAPYDFAPQRYTFATEPVRGSGAEMDSYDGRGHGFIFLITSHEPLNMAPLMDGFEFGELDVKDYGSMLDPRIAVRRVADAIAGRDGYTLRFATSFNTYSYASSAFRGFGCNSGYSSMFGRRHYGSYYDSWYDDFDVIPMFWSSWGVPTWYAAPWSSRRLSRGCGHQYALNFYRFMWSQRSYDQYPWTERPVITTVGSVPPTGPLTPVITKLRPTVGDSGRATAKGGRSAIDRHTIVTRARDSEGAERITLRNGKTIKDFLAESERQPVARTHAAAFDRPGPTRVLNETHYRRRTYVEPKSYSQPDNSWDWMRETRPSPKSDSPSSTRTAESSGSSGSSGSTTVQKGSAGAGGGATPKKH
jgi:hypothetical protein